MLVAPIIHARTKNNDFPSGLLVIPADFSPQDVSWARKYILDSTRYFELAGSAGRRVAFCSEDVIVTGISINIGDLYRSCGREPKYDYVDGNRVNYGFIGVAFHKSEVDGPVIVSDEELLRLYERYMETLWDEEFHSEGMTDVKGAYESCESLKEVSLCELPVIGNGDPKLVIEDKFAPLESLMATVIHQMLSLPRYAFCSNMPNATSVLDSSFEVVTSTNAQGIIAVMEKKQRERAAAETAASDAKGKTGFSGFLRKQDRNREKPAEQDLKYVRIKQVIGGLLVLAGALWILITNRDSE